MKNDQIVITSIARTPCASLQGEFASLSAIELGGKAVAAALERSDIKAEQIDEVIMGCVLSAGLGQAPARQAALSAGLLQSTPCTTINKMCGSGMKAVMQAHDQLVAGSAKIVVAGGLESMTNAPYLLPRARAGLRLGHAEIKDHMFLDGLEDAYDKGKLMGCFAENTAEKYGFSREQQDSFAIESLSRARRANESGWFDSEIIPVVVRTKKGQIEVKFDQQPLTADPDKIPTLRPVFRKDGTVTAANSSSISDGAAALVLMRRSHAEANGLTALATIIGHASYAHDPAWFTTAPVGAVNKLFDQSGLKRDRVDLYEINEAFAVVTMATMQDLELEHEKVNIHGGACALGHPIGASGARIMVTLLAALQKYDLTTGVAAICIGGGEATAIAIERIR